MPQNSRACDREQELLLPPSLRELLPRDHFAWFVIEVVDGLDLTAFTASYRSDGWGPRRARSGDDGGVARVRLNERARRDLVAAL
jgi:hypothetical protein